MRSSGITDETRIRRLIGLYDIAVIGAGPAGLSAAITARARNREVLVISNKPQNSPLAKALRVDNYPGLPQVSGLRLLEKMVEQAVDMGAAFDFRKTASILSMGEYFSIGVGDDIAECRSVILATGAQSAKPYAGEVEYLGRGVSYCATCDGMLYRKTRVCVVGLSRDATEEANFLAEIGCEVIFLAKKPPEGLAESIIVKIGSVTEIKGDGLGVTELVFKPTGSGAGAEAGAGVGVGVGAGAGAGAGVGETIACNGVFILRPSVAPDALISGLRLNEGYIAVDAAMRTNIPGVFAAGDCTGKPLQIAKATGEGQTACFSAVAYLG